MPVLIYTPTKYKLYDNKESISIHGSFFIIENNLKKNTTEQTFFNLESLFIHINDKTFTINISTCEIEQSNDNINDCVQCTDIHTIGETIQREFYLSNDNSYIDNVIIKIIKNINKYHNLVEISSFYNIQSDEMDKMNNMLDNVASKPIPIPIKDPSMHQIWHH